MVRSSSRNRKGKKHIRAIDLFCGVGGLTHGLKRSGIDVVLGIDTDPACEYPYEKNNGAKFLRKSVEDLSADELMPYLRDADITLLAGCAPCQTFSTYNQKAKPTDRRWWLLSEFSRLIGEVSPDIVTMENVPGLMKRKVFDDFVRELDANGYDHVNYRIVHCEEYGIPQHRQRLVLLASRLGPIRLLSPEEFDAPRRHVRHAIADLPPIAAGEVHPDDPLHRSSALSELNLRRIKASRPGGTWRDWDSSLIADCHRKTTGRTYPGVYGRMKWDEPAPTITTQYYGFGNGRFGHPEQDRAISLREGAILQSFPPDYVFVPPGEEIYVKTIGRLVGNAVPVRLGEVIGKSIFEHLSVCALLEDFRRERVEYA